MIQHETITAFVLHREDAAEAWRGFGTSFPYSVVRPPNARTWRGIFHGTFPIHLLWGWRAVSERLPSKK